MPFGFTDRTRIENLYAEQGLDNILDDIPALGQDGVLDQFIEDAEQTIIVRLSKFYESTDMATNAWIQSRATWIAAYYVSKRRGNEHYFQSLYEEALRELDAMATGEIPPITEIPLRAHSLPSMANFVIDDYFSARKLRVRQGISVGPSPNQDVSYVFGWL